MGLFSDIISAVGNAANDVGSFFSGGNDDDQKRKQNNGSTSSPIIPGSKVNLPSALRAPQGGPSAPKAPVFTLQNNNSNLTAQPPQSQPQPDNGGGGGFFHDLLHNPVTNVVGSAGKDVGEVAAAAVPEVGLGLARVGTGLVQGVTQVPHILTAATATGTKALANTGLPGANDLNDVVQGANTGVKAATNFVNKPINALNRGIDTVAQDYSNVGPLAGMGEQDYKDTQIPLNIIAGLATLGAAPAAEGAEGAADAGESGGLISRISDFLNKARGGSDSDAISKISQPVINVTKPVVNALNTPIKSVTDLIRGGEAGEGAGELAGDESAPSENTPPETGTKPIDEPVNSPAGETGTPTVEPGTTETGTKPGPGPSNQGLTPSELQALESKPATATGGTPPTGTPTPADIQAAENNATEQVNKTSENPPTPAPAPTTAAADVSPKEAAAIQAAEAPNQIAADEVPNLLNKTGDKQQDVQNTTNLVRNLLENGRNYEGDDLPTTLARANSHLNSNADVAGALNNRINEGLTDSEASNVRNAIETGSAKGLSDKEAVVVKAIQENIENPSNTVRTNLSKDFQAADNHFPQVRQSSVKNALTAANQVKGMNSKINTFNDLLNRNSRFSQGSTLGKFTNNGKTIVGDAPGLGLVAKKDGTFVDKAGKVYQYSRATSQELENAGTKLQAPKDALSAYVRDTLNLKTRADASDYLIKNADNLGLSDAEAEGKTTPVTIKSSQGEDKTFFTDAKTAKDIKDSGIIGNFGKEANLPTRAWNALSSLIAQTTVMNPTAHGANLVSNAFVRGGAGALKDAFTPLDDATRFRMSEDGVHFPTYGKDASNALSRLTGGASKLNERAISTIDAHARAGLYEQLTDKGMAGKDAAKQVNDWLGGKSVYKGDSAQLGIFWKYFVRQNVNAGRILSMAAKGNIKPLINAAVVAGTTYGADKGLQAATGNKGAYMHVPGVVGIANDYLKSGEDLAKGQFRSSVNPIVSHVNPLVQQVAEQTLGVDNYGNKFQNGQARVDNALGMTPVSSAFDNNGHSLAEKGLNTFGIYTPHIKGDMAVSSNAPGAPVLNVKGAQNGSTVAFPKDFTGEKNQAAVNNAVSAGAPYSSKLAASTAGQTQAQQKAYDGAVKTLKTIGITDASDVQNFSKLSTEDQGSYVTAAKQLSQAGTSISSGSIQSQLVKNGKTALAANLNKDIPGSLPQESKEALETYSTLGSNGQKGVWLQDNNNALSYYNAVLRQKQAQGALTTADTDTGSTYSGSGGSLAVKALVAKTNQQNNVPQSLVELYANTTKTEYNNMSGTEKTELTNYATQLNKNGVIDKFGLADGTSGSSGNSSSDANSRDLAAGIPDSGNAVVKPQTNSDLKAGTAKYVAPKLAVATVAAGKNDNPFVRSISASKGVKI